jgi:hypothetical protein
MEGILVGFALSVSGWMQCIDYPEYEIDQNIQEIVSYWCLIEQKKTRIG